MPPRFIGATVILDSITKDGDRITTLECTLPRCILAELNTHRAFSRNSASSRAIPVYKLTEQVRHDPYVPLEWRHERRGMSGGEPVDPIVARKLESMWRQSARVAADVVDEMSSKFFVHKSIINRLLEPYLWHTVIITATDWHNFFTQRLKLLADGVPEADVPMHRLALAMRDALDNSTPTTRAQDEWHIPYLTHADADLDPITQRRVSVARCARVSYLTHDGVRDPKRDLELFERLLHAPHPSPFEHVARATTSRYCANFHGWASLRYLTNI